MRYFKTITVLFVLIAFSVSAAAIPDLPHQFYGDITDTDGPEKGINVSVYHDSSFVTSALTQAEGNYDIKVPYSSSYDGEQLDVQVEDNKIGTGIVFEQGASTEVNYVGENILQDPFTVSGTITEDGSGIETSVTFYNDNNSIGSTTSGSAGSYSIDIPFSDGYDGETIEFYVNDTDTNKTTTFVTGSSDTLDFDFAGDSTDDTTNDTTDDNTTDDNTTDSTDDSTDSTDDSTDSTDDSTDSTDDSTDSTDDSGENVDSSLGDDGSTNDSTDDSSTGSGYQVDITDISSAPEEANIGETVKFFVTVTNSGSETTDYPVTLTVGSQTFQKTLENLSPGDTETVTFEKEFDSPGELDVSAGDQSHSIRVNDSAEEGGMGMKEYVGIGGLLIILLVGGLKLFGGTKNEMKEEKQGALDAFKEEKQDQEDEGGEEFDWRYADSD